MKKGPYKYEPPKKRSGGGGVDLCGSTTKKNLLVFPKLYKNLLKKLPDKIFWGQFLLPDEGAIQSTVVFQIPFMQNVIVLARK